MTTANLTSNLDSTVARFHRASADVQLVILHCLAKKLHQASTKTTPSAYFSQKVQAVIKQLQQLPRPERHHALEEILTGVPTRLTEAYEELDTNMRMAFWYRLANGRRDESLLPGSSLQSTSDPGDLLAELESRDSNELVSFLRDAVSELRVASA